MFLCPYGAVVYVCYDFILMLLRSKAATDARAVDSVK